MPANAHSRPSWLAVTKKGDFQLLLHVQPNAKRTAVVGIHGGRLKVALAAPPVDGKANAVLLKAFAKHLGVSKSAEAIASGESSREKRLEVTGLTEAELLAAFRDLDTD